MKNSPELNVCHFQIRLLEMSDLDPLLEKEVKEVNTVMNLPKVATAALLRQHEWNKERLFDKYYSDSDKVVQDAGVNLWKAAAESSEGKEESKTEETGKGGACCFGTVALPKAASGSETECQICIDDFGPEDVVAAPCGHF